jgi:hypothetical protein
MEELRMEYPEYSGVEVKIVDENLHPIEVPGLILETREEKEEYQAGYERYLLRKKREK